MAFIEKITQPGNALSSSLNGKLVLDYGRAEVSIRNADSDDKLVYLDTQGLTVADDDERRLRAGRNPQGTRVNIWVSPDGTDVIDLLESEG